jgi:hypothetical protein
MSNPRVRRLCNLTHGLSIRFEENGQNALPNEDKLILVAGATGYVGGRLVPRLLQAGIVFAACGARRAIFSMSPGFR